MTEHAVHPLLNQLADIQQPLTVSWWPPAPIFWLCSVMLILLSAVMVFLWRRRKKLRYAALAELERIIHNFRKRENHSQLAMDINILLRRIARLRYPDCKAAALFGSDWLEFLDRHGDTSAYTQGYGAILVSAPYQSEPNFDADALIQLARHWITQNT